MLVLAGRRLARFALNLNHLTLPEIKYFNASSDVLCLKLNAKRFTRQVATGEDALLGMIDVTEAEGSRRIPNCSTNSYGSNGCYQLMAAGPPRPPLPRSLAMPMILFIVIIGAAAGFLATRFMKVQADVPTTIAIGVFGSVVCWLILRVLVAVTGAVAMFVGAVLGAVLLLWLWQRYGPR